VTTFGLGPEGPRRCRGSFPRSPPAVLVEPFSYRFHEMFGDDGRSAIDFEMEVQKEEDPRETLSSS